MDRVSDPMLNAGLDELRQSTRFRKEPGADSAVVWQVRGQEQLVDVYDESLGGICLVLRKVGTFAVGTTATIVYHSDVMEGTVRHIDPQADGTFLIGFECRPWHAA